jgi:hypothetical protein
LKEVHGYAFSYNSFSKFVLPINTGSNRQFVGWSDGTTIYPGGSSVEEKELIVYRAVFYSSYTPVAGDLVVKNGVVVSHNINIEENPEIVIPSTYNGETITGIGYRLFYQSKLESITLPSTLVSINEEAFFNSPKLAKLDISKCINLKNIEKSALGFLKISTLDLSTCPNLEIVNDYAFVNSQISTLNLSNCSKLEKIGDHAFNGNLLTAVDLSPCTSLKFIGRGAFVYCPMSGFKLPKSTINGEVVTTWVNENNTTFNAGSTVSNLDFGYTAKLNQINVYPLDAFIEYGTIDRGKTHRRSFNIFNQSKDTLFIKEVNLPDGFSVQSNQNFIAPMGGWFQWVYFAPTENKDYSGEFGMTFSNTTQVVKVKANATVNPNYDIKFLVKNETGPLANAKVTIDGKTTISTNQNGEANYAYVAPNTTLNYVVEATGYYPSKGTLNVIQHLTKQVALELISFPVNFAISSNNQAVEGAKVTLDGYGELLTDGQGKVSFPKVVPQTNLKFTVVKNGYIVETGSLTVSNEAVSKNIALTLITCNVSIVCFEKGSPVSGATVELNGYGQQLTNQDGIALFEKVEPTDSIGFTVLKKGYLSEEGLLALTGAKVEKRLELQRKNYNITLQCLSNGQVMEGVTVDLGAYGQQVSDVDGFVRFNQVLYSETQRYTANLYGYAQAAGAIAFVDGDSIQPISIDFVGYRVEIAVFSGNTPVKDAVVILDGFRSAQTNENGIAVFNAILTLDTIAYKINQEGFVPVDGLLVPAADKVTKAQVVLETLPVGIRFSCTSNGLPLAGVTVELEGYGTQVSDAKGVATFTNVAHTDKLNYQATLEGYDKLSGTLTGITKDKDQVIQLDLTTYTITLWCKDGSKALHGVYVELEGYGKQQTDENGKVIFEKVLPHDSIRYKLEAESYQAVSGFIAVVGSDMERYMAMEKMKYTIEFTTSNNGLPLAGVTVELEGYGTQVSDAKGVATFTNVAHTDKLNYQATLEGYYKLTGTLTGITKDIDQSLQLNLITYKVSFLVSEATGPITGAAVTLSNYGVRFTNEKGVAVFDSVAPANSLEYEIQAEKYIAQTGKVAVTNSNVELKIELEKDKTGVKNQPSAQLSIYPNPANRLMTIEGAKGEWVTIYNNAGQMVLRFQSLSNAETIDVGQIPNGSYLVKTSKYQAKLIVAHD